MKLNDALGKIMSCRYLIIQNQILIIHIKCTYIFVLNANAIKINYIFDKNQFMLEKRK